MIDGLSNFLDDKGMKSVNELRGRAVQRLQRMGRPRSQLQGRRAGRSGEVHRLRPVSAWRAATRSVDCIHIGEHPLPAGHRAPTREAAIARSRETGVHVTWVDWDECTGCNLCSHVCPVPGCITMADDTRGAPFETWNDRIAKGTAKVPGGLHD